MSNDEFFKISEARAKEIATKAHEGQKRKDGKDYITHPEALVSKFHKSAYDLRTIAWLHDVVEDTSVNISHIYSEFGEYIGDAVKALTHHKERGESYIAHLLKVKANEAATQVKERDLEHNLGDNPNGTMRDKYLMAQHILKE